MVVSVLVNDILGSREGETVMMIVHGDCKLLLLVDQVLLILLSDLLEVV